MKTKTFDCVEMQRNIRDKFWKDGGETIEGLLNLLKVKEKDSYFIKYFNKEKALLSKWDSYDESTEVKSILI